METLRPLRRSVTRSALDRRPVKQTRRTVGATIPHHRGYGQPAEVLQLTGHQTRRAKEGLELPDQGGGRCDPIAVRQLKDFAAPRRVEPEVHLGHARMGREDLVESFNDWWDAAGDGHAYHHRTATGSG